VQSWKTPNLTISPHVAGASCTRTGSRIVATVVENLGRYLRNEPLLHKV
jgi:phosphoglycerate dehydrogenase-like enzyme